MDLITEIHNISNIKGVGEMENEVYGSAIIDVSVPTKKDTESEALDEIKFKTDLANVKEIELKITDFEGNVTYFDIHAFRFIMKEFFND